jgi:hypothetical protein
MQGKLSRRVPPLFLTKDVANSTLCSPCRRTESGSQHDKQNPSRAFPSRQLASLQPGDAVIGINIHHLGFLPGESVTGASVPV